MRNLWFCLLILFCFGCLVAGAPQADSEGWYSLFNGKDLSGWKAATENPESFSVQDGTLVVKGGRSHLFYMGPVGNHSFKNFQFQAQVKLTPGTNSGIYFHTVYEETGFPTKGYEAQLNNTHKNSQKTGSLFAVEPVETSLVQDGEWFDYFIEVRGKKILIRINGKQVVDYTEPEQPERAKNMLGRVLGSGTFALQAHDPTCTVYVRNIRVKPLSD